MRLWGGDGSESAGEVGVDLCRSGHVHPGREGVDAEEREVLERPQVLQFLHLPLYLPLSLEEGVQLPVR